MWNKILEELFDLVEELVSDRNLKNSEKLDALAAEIAQLLEALDDAAVSLLPPGIGLLAKGLIDNPMVDQAQKDLMVKPIAEFVYQMWKLKQAWLGKAG